jgi:hypothetical protein
LRGLVQRGAKRARRLIALEALALAVAAPLALLWLSFALDNWLHLPVWGRAVAGVAFVGTLGALVWRLVRHWRRTKLTEDQVALAMERRTPGGVQNRLINSLQMARGEQAGDAALSGAVVAENFHVLERVTLEQAAQARPAMIRIGLAVMMVLVGVVFWVWGVRHEAQGSGQKA